MPDAEPVDDGQPRGVGIHLKNALTAAHDALADKIDARKKQTVEDILHQSEADLAPIIGPVVQRIIDSPGASDELKAVMAEAGAPAHQFGSIVIGFALGATIGPALGAALAPELQAVENTAWGANPSRPISPDVAVASVLKGITGPNDPAGEAKQSGYNASRFAQMVDAAGQAIGFEAALSLSRRGLLVGVTLEQVLRYSNVNPKFYASALNLVHDPPSTGAVLTGALKHHLADGQARTLYAQAGGNPTNYDWELASSGRPLGLEEMLHLLNRKVMTEQQVRDGIAQSEINDTYTDFALQLQHYFPPPRSIVPMLRAKAITVDQANTLLGYYGVDAEWSAAFIKEAQTSSTSTAKTLTQAQVTGSYELQLITRTDALARLEKVGFDAEDATAILDLADEKRTQAMDNAVVRMIGSRYVTRKLTKPQATTQLNKIPIPQAAQGDLFHLWDIELAITVHHLTPGQVVGAFRRGLITAGACKTRLLDLGVVSDDLQIVVADGYPPTKPAEAVAAAHAVFNA